MYRRLPYLLDDHALPVGIMVLCGVSAVAFGIVGLPWLTGACMLILILTIPFGRKYQEARASKAVIRLNLNACPFRGTEPVYGRFFTRKRQGWTFRIGPAPDITDGPIIFRCDACGTHIRMPAHFAPKPFYITVTGGAVLPRHP